MYRPCLKSKVFENPNPFMWCSKEGSGASFLASNSIGDWSIPDDCKEPTDGDQAPPTAIVIVEPRQMRIATNTTNPTSPTSISGSSSSSSTSSSSSSSSSGGSEAIGFSSSNGHTPEWFMLPQAVDVNNDVMRLVSSLSTVVQILTRMTNAAAQELRQHPEREEGFQGLRLLLNYADQMYTTLLQPQPFSSERPASPNRSVTAQPYSLFHHLFEPMLGNMEREEEVSVRQLQPAAGRSFPYRVVAVAASAAVSASGPESNGSIAPTSEFGANVNQIRN